MEDEKKLEEVKPEEKTEGKSEGESEEKEETGDKSEEKSEEKKETEDKSEEKSEEKKKTEEKKPEPDSTMEPVVLTSEIVRKRKEKKKRGKVLAIVFGTIFGLLLIAYFVGVFYFSKHFMYGTRVNGRTVDFKTVEEVEAMLAPEKDSYFLDILTKTGKETIKVGDGSLKREYSVPIQELLEDTSPFAWPYYLFEQSDYTVDYLIKYSKPDMEIYLNNLSCMDASRAEASKNAYVVLKDGEVQVVPESQGTLLDEQKVYDAVEAALDGDETSVNLDQEDCYRHADITEDSESIQQAKKNAEEYLAIDAVYVFGDYKYKIPAEEMTSMAYIDRNGNVVLDEDVIKNYAHTLALQFDSFGKDRKFVTHDKKHIVISGGYYGWEIDEEAEAEELWEYMQRMEDFEKEPVCVKKGYNYCGLNDIGDSYVEVDLTDQHVYLYVDGKQILDSDCVTGRPSMRTPGGVYPITYCQAPAILHGADYETPVSYWMPFNGGIGLHDSWWRREGVYGGDIWTYDGSHGCVNLPVSVAGQIYDHVEKGFPVVCYWEDEVGTY